MRSLSLLAQKGGAGKTTLAVHLAIYTAMRGERVALIDTDPQRSTADWWRARRQSSPAMAVCAPNKLSTALEAAAKRGFTLAVVDTHRAPTAPRT